MIKYIRLFSTSFLCMLAGWAFAQNGTSPTTNSPYTRYGFGQLSDQGFGNSKAMGGIGYGLRNGYHINPTNPASYSAVDSLTFIFDLGVSLQNANFKENGIKKNAMNSTFDYVAMQYRLRRGIGMTIGMVPFSNVGYNFQASHTLTDKASDTSVTTLSTYDGTGGLQQVFAGIGYSPTKNLSVGINASYLYGDIDHKVYTSFSNSYAYTSARRDEISVSDYKLDFGLQYKLDVNKTDQLTLGATYGLGHKLNSDGYQYIEMYNSSSLLTQTVDTITDGFELPTTIGAGFTYIRKNRLTVGADFTLQKWEKTKYFGEKGQFSDWKKVSLGMEFVPNWVGRKYYKRISYRAGLYYSEPYTKIDGKAGAKEYGASVGLGLPLFLYNYRTYLNISGQYIHVKPQVSGMLEENYLKINIGLTFNERWFMKWKVD